MFDARSTIIGSPIDLSDDAAAARSQPRGTVYERRLTQAECRVFEIPYGYSKLVGRVVGKKKISWTVENPRVPFPITITIVNP